MKAAGQSPVFKSGILVAIVGKSPAESIAVKSLDNRNSFAVKFDVVDGCLAHGFLKLMVLISFFANVS
jgi:hypothetical protein